MKNKLVTTLLGTLVFTGACGATTKIGGNQEAKANKVNVQKVMLKAEAASETKDNENLDLKDVFLNTLKEKGPDMITSALTSAGAFVGKELAFKLLEACGLDLSDGTAKALDNIYKQLKEINSKLNVLDKKVDQYHSEDIMNQIFKYTDYVDNNLKPMLTSGIATIIADEKGGKKTEQELETERKKYYEDNLKTRTFQNGALLVNYITDFAKAIVKPNDANQSENIFAYYRATLGKTDKWSYQEYKNERNFIACLEGALLIGTNLARYDLYYRTQGCEQATVNTYNEYLNNLISAVKDVNTLFQKELKRLDEVENDRVKNHTVIYLPTNTKYSNRLGTLTFNYNDKERAGLVVRSKDNDYDFKYTPDNNLINSVTNDYIQYKQAFKTDEYTINEYLKDAGFYAKDNKLFETSAGLYKDGLNHVRCGLYNHDTETKAQYIDRFGKEQTKIVYKVNVYHNWIGEPSDVRIDNLDNNYYLVFMKPGDTELVGKYTDTYFNNVKEGRLVNNFPFQIDGNRYFCEVKAEVKANY